MGKWVLDPSAVLTGALAGLPAAPCFGTVVEADFVFVQIGWLVPAHVRTVIIVIRMQKQKCWRYWSEAVPSCSGTLPMSVWSKCYFVSLCQWEVQKVNFKQNIILVTSFHGNLRSNSVLWIIVFIPYWKWKESRGLFNIVQKVPLASTWCSRSPEEAPFSCYLLDCAQACSSFSDAW